VLAGVMLVDGLSQMGIDAGGHSTKKGDHGYSAFVGQVLGSDITKVVDS